MSGQLLKLLWAAGLLFSGLADLLGLAEVDISFMYLPLCLIYNMKGTVKRVCRGAFLTDDIKVSILVVLKKVEFKALFYKSLPIH